MAMFDHTLHADTNTGNNKATAPHRLAVDQLQLLDTAIRVEHKVLEARVHAHLTPLGCKVVHQGLAQTLWGSTVQERHLAAVTLLQRLGGECAQCESSEV